MIYSWKIATLVTLSTLTLGASDAFHFSPLLFKTHTRPFTSSNYLSLFPSDLFNDFDKLIDRQFSAGFDDFFDRPWMLGSPGHRLLQPSKEGEDGMVLKRSSPWYEITEDEDQFQLAIDVPGVKPEDLNVHLESDGRVLRMTGKRKVEEGSMKSETRFEKAFLLDKRIDKEAITANLRDGVVVITAPKKEVEAKETKQIPITQHSTIAEKKPKVEENVVAKE
eukprot:CAMPEP_0195511650 /NCGR_PEP_ID=MMETSP0794_2-20130614/3900_1 /TAXON_ID=515487 /ORGANISM="Stephanopyxis turris, Strain CCMP 815" /LENGTH=221 /DNA_ID=CAMNT_0040639299 /DNA_START=112 /DNA_END=777 /DNA_ORIENTATION=-